MKARRLYCMLCMAVLGMLNGCGTYTTRVETDEEIRHPDETEEETLGEHTELYEAAERENKNQTGEAITDEDGIYQIRIPSGWELCEDKLNETMLFELQGETEDQYMGILVLTDEVYGRFDLTAYMDAYKDNMRQQFDNAIMSETMEIDVNGHKAYTLRVTGTVNEMEYMNHICAVEYADEKVIFTASTYEEHEKTVEDTLQEIVYSFAKLSAEE